MAMQHPSALSTLDAELQVAQEVRAAVEAATKAREHLHAASEIARKHMRLEPLSMLLVMVTTELASAEARLGLLGSAAASAARAAAIRESSAKDSEASP
jgi:hypothetical protein